MAKDKPPKRGRPATGHTPKRYFRMDDTAWALVEQAAAASDQTVSDYVRDTLARAAKRTNKANNGDAPGIPTK